MDGIPAADHRADAEARQEADAVLFGAVGDWKTISLERKLAPSRPSWACVRTWACLPTSGPPSATSSEGDPASSPSWWPGLDILIIRELTGDIYFWPAARPP